ncbi:MAG: S1C family serine protease [Vicinamibacterales bacterium]
MRAVPRGQAPAGGSGLVLLVLGLACGLGLGALGLAPLTPAADDRPAPETSASSATAGHDAASEGRSDVVSGAGPGSDARAASTGSGIVPAVQPERPPAAAPLAPTVAGAGATPPLPHLAAEMRPLEDVVAAVVPGVVSVQAGRARGTGFFIGPDRLITNAHVVGDASTVILQAGDTRWRARVVTVATGSDLAVLQLDAGGRAPAVLPLGAPADVRVGQEVIAVGSALGVLSNTVTRGIVSAVRRVGTVTLIQTDAAINPGNSGGPLVDRAGRVIGVTTLKAGAQAESLGFAVAAEHASALLERPGRVATARAAPPAAAGPATGLEAVLGGTPPVSADARRDAGGAAYDEVLAAAGRQADQLDASWTRNAGSCAPDIRTPARRPWLVVLTEAAPFPVRNGCRDWIASMTAAARNIDLRLRQAAEEARRAGVYPGALRESRRRHGLDWDGWDR